MEICSVARLYEVELEHLKMTVFINRIILDKVWFTRKAHRRYDAQTMCPKKKLKGKLGIFVKSSPTYYEVYCINNHSSSNGDKC